MRFVYAISLLLLTACSATKQIPVSPVLFTSVEEEQLFREVQEKTFQYFWDGAEPTSGLARERFHTDGIYPQNDKSTVTS